MTQASQDNFLEEFDPVEVYVAIADFKGAEESNVSLRAGQCVQVSPESDSTVGMAVGGKCSEKVSHFLFAGMFTCVAMHALRCWTVPVATGG